MWECDIHIVNKPLCQKLQRYYDVVKFGHDDWILIPNAANHAAERTFFNVACTYSN